MTLKIFKIKQAQAIHNQSKATASDYLIHPNLQTDSVKHGSLKIDFVNPTQ